MTDTFYAWSNFHVHEPGEPGKTVSNKPSKTFKPGDEISPGDLGYEGTDDPDWVAMCDAGAIRTTPYPDMGNWGGSPVEYAKARIAAMAEQEDFTDFQYGTAKVPTEDEVSAIEAGDNLAPEAAQATTTPQKETEAKAQSDK
jgi:hypothetical protein